FIMGEKGTKICLITFNVICMICGIAMFVGGLLIQLNPTVKNILSSVATTASQTQLGIVAVVLIALGAFVTFIAFVGCCGAVSESRCMLTMYFLSLLILLLAQIGIAVAALVYGSQGFTNAINTQLGILVRGYGPDPTSAAIVDTIQQTFSCCGYTGPEDYKKTWPDSCCVRVNDVYKNLTQYHVTLQGCTASIDEFTKQYMIIIGAVGLGIALIEIIAMIAACSLRANMTHRVQNCQRI
uniref:Tetraspanin n=1 Tax=Ciona intestinalis TaxID=7719 RepID=H2XYJ6_CIOIN